MWAERILVFLSLTVFVIAKNSIEFPYVADAGCFRVVAELVHISDVGVDMLMDI